MSDSIRLGAVAIDCPDPRVLGAFYHEITGWDVGYESDGFVALGLRGGVWLTMHRVENYEAPTWPNPDTPKQFHLDFAVDDLEATERRAIAAGASKAEFQPAPDRFRVFTDPAGHPFCLSTQFPDS